MRRSRTHLHRPERPGGPCAGAGAAGKAAGGEGAVCRGGRHEGSHLWRVW